MIPGRTFGRRSSRRPRDRRGVALALSLAGLVLAAAPAQAHPHIWVNVELDLSFDHDQLTAIREIWTFDEFYTAMAIQDLPSKTPGVYTREDLAELARENVSGMREFGYFTTLQSNGGLVPFTEAVDPAMDYKAVDQAPSPTAQFVPDPMALPPGVDANGNVTRKKGPETWAGWLWSLLGGSSAPTVEKPKVAILEFTLPLQKPVPAKSLSLDVSVTDPTIFIWYDYVKPAVRFGTGAPSTCKVEVKDAGAEALKPPTGPGDGPPPVSFVSGKIAHITC